MYSLCSNQYIIGPAGPLELDVGTIFTICDRLKISDEESLEVLERIKLIVSTLLETLQLDAEEKARVKKYQGSR